MDGGARLELFEVLGEGGQGVVQRARLVHAGGPSREVAVKRLMPAEDLRVAARAIARLRDEATALASIAHPAIPDFVALQVVDDALALVTRYVHGHDLGRLLADGVVFPPRAVADLLEVVADALDCAWSSPDADGHPLHLVHRDIKPSNLRLDVRGRPWLLDFGLARGARQERHAWTVTQVVVGTPGYLAPERWDGREATLASDVFSLGLVALEALGAPPALPPEAGGVRPGVLVGAAAWAGRRAARLAELPELGPDLADLLTRMLAWSPEDRPSPAEVRAAARACRDVLTGPDLVDVAAGLPAPVARTTEPSRVVVPEVSEVPATVEVPLAAAPRRRWTPLILGLFLAAGAGAWWLQGTSDTEPPTRSSETTAPGALPPVVAAPVAPAAEAEPVVPVTAEAVEAPDANGDEVAPPPAADAPPVRSRRAVTAAAPDAPDAPSSGGRAVVEVPPAPTSGWRVVAPGRARLRRGDLVAAPGGVAPGSWQVEADFGEGFVPAGEVIVPVSGELVVRCMPWLGLCEAVR
ncbi:MAG: serine/threonine protein kinase [Alphaproteobacteria bacterium]|nr:serine/threonine protein kinase [Alphaproteobacteria bacterium]